jgi:hypothetical protein
MKEDAMDDQAKIDNAIPVDRADEFTGEIAELAARLETIGGRLKQWCEDQPVDYVVICELTVGIASSAERIAAELIEARDELRPLIYG